MYKPDYAAVIFDLDGVLTDTAHYHYLAWKRLADTLEIAFDQAANEHLKGIDRMGSLDLILGPAGQKYTPAQKMALADEKNLHYQHLISSMTPADLLPGALDALHSVKAAGLKLGLASVSKNALTVVERLGIRALFDDIVDAATIAKSKPDPEIFLAAAHHVMVEPSRCLGVEDSIAGIRSIKSAGMTALGIGDPAILTEADRVIAGLYLFSLADY
ncbi:MAG TPA: beta-phosphoglucomutase [Burkholderiaceae bacterium]|jgi:beta-phosphoglucomutase|nr:beta-phosphoglucomutase [Burkholderiaceae bacterium]